MVTYSTPNNLVELLNKVLKAASHTGFYKTDVHTIKTLEEYAQINPVSLKTYREQKLSDLLVEHSTIDWIARAFRDTNLGLASIVENPDQTESRY